MPNVSCIIPVYNEKPRIANVLKAVVGHPLIHEVVVVDDGSNDGTEDLVKQFSGVKLIRHEVNKGKTQAVVTGI